MMYFAVSSHCFREVAQAQARRKAMKEVMEVMTSTTHARTAGKVFPPQLPCGNIVPRCTAVVKTRRTRSTLIASFMERTACHSV